MYDLFSDCHTDTDEFEKIETELSEMSLGDKVEYINRLRLFIHDLSPFKDEPVDLVQWVPVVDVTSNDYNPNSVAPPEMELLRHSINHDGYTQPVVTWMSDEKEQREVIDGFHRSRVCMECEDVNQRVNGFLPVVTVRHDNTSKNDRIASTIRHNRARGKHQVDSMTDIVVELKKRNWSDKKISRELGMDQDEILRLCQVSGLVELFQNEEFSESWDVGIFEESAMEAEFVPETQEKHQEQEGRIYHTWDKWECYDAGFHGTTPPKGMSKEDAEEKYKELLSDCGLFAEILEKVIVEWKHSCEHNLTNESMNRIAWLGQAALAYELSIPSCFRGGYNLLTKEQQEAADATAIIYLNKWLIVNGRDAIEVESAKTRVDQY